MDRRSLVHFIAVAEHGSVSRAAEALHLSQPALSRSIAALEGEVGLPLFQRVSRGVVMTDVARRMLQRARAIVAEFYNLVEETHAVGGTMTGSVRVALSVSLVDEAVTAIIAQLITRHRGISVDAWGHHSTARLVSAVEDGGHDVALVGSRHMPTGRGLVVEQLYREEILVAMPAASPLARSDRIAPADLDGLPFIAEPESPIRELLNELVDQHGPRVAARISYRQGLLPLVENGVGLALITDSLRRFSGRSQVVVRGFAPPVEIPIWMVTRDALTPASAAFAAIARDYGRDATAARAPVAAQ